MSINHLFLVSQETRAVLTANFLKTPELRETTRAKQRQMIIAEYREKSRSSRTTHQQSLTEMEELRKFQSSTFDRDESSSNTKTKW